MLPKFPNFKKISLSDKSEVEKLTSNLPPYSDFSFYNIWGWNINNEMKVSQLNKNLIVLFNDYISKENFLSIIGDEKIKETVSAVISFSEEKYKKKFIKLVPEEIAFKLKNSGFNIKEDRDSSDYIYLVSNLADMKNWSQNTSGKRIRGFLRKNLNYTVRNELMTKISHKEHENIFKKWAVNKKIYDHFDLNEYKAFERFLKLKDENIKIVSIYIDEILVGFTIYEILSKNYAISHFAKVNKEYDESVSDLLNWEEAKILHAQGIKYFNWEQDLGMPGLRFSKIKYRPAFILKKYIVSKEK